MKQKIIQTADGSHTIYLPEIDEQFHSLNGAITESNYVFIEKGYNFHNIKNPVVFEVGFGTGLNALLTAIEAEKQNRKTTFITIEKYPLEENTIQQLNYGNLIQGVAKNIYEKIHDCEWNNTIQITKYFKLQKLKSDIIEVNLTNFKKFDVIYFDAFGPDKQPEIWTSEIFRKIFSQCTSKAIFVTYSAKGEVRRNLSSTGFLMERLPGPPGKKQMLRGIKSSSVL